MFSNKVKTINADYTYYSPDNTSIEEAKRIALERAKIQGLSDEFGTVISQSSSTILTLKNGESDSQFFSISGSEIKGEWIETIGEPKFEIAYENNQLIVRCIVKGRAREIDSARIEYTAKPLRNGQSIKFESNEFRDGDDFYLFFQTPVDGFVAIYLLDEASQKVYNILPYKKQSKSAIEVLANREYIFFSREQAGKEEQMYLDEYTLTCENDKEFNTIYILFSTSAIGKKAGFDSTIDDEPDYITLKNFKQWLSNSLAKDKNLQLQEINLTISK